MNSGSTMGTGSDQADDPGSYAKAVLNILEDFTDEKEKLTDVQKAMLNIMEDLDAEKRRVEQTNVEMAKEIAGRMRAEDALEAAEVAYKELEAFSYSVSHDLRTPLRAIDGFCQALVEDYSGRLDGPGKDYLNRARTASHQMAQLIDDILKLSRITRSEMQREAVDLSEMVRAIAAELRQMEPGRAVEFVIEGGLTVNGDKRLLRVMMENLLGNAWKFTGKRESAKIEFGVGEHEGRPAFYVRDNGAGFDMAYANKLFGPFQRLHRATEFPGTGIGLATVQRVMRRHGGRAWAEGEVGKGATFYFQLQRTGEGG